MFFMPSVAKLPFTTAPSLMQAAKGAPVSATETTPDAGVEALPTPMY